MYSMILETVTNAEIEKVKNDPKQVATIQSVADLLNQRNGKL